MKQRGLSLLEVLVAMGVAVIVGVLLVSIMVNSAGLFYKQSSSLQEGLNINDTLGKVREAVKESKAVVTSYTSGGTTYTSSAAQLVLKLASVDPLGNIIVDVFDHVVFFQDQNKLRYKSFPDPQSSRKMQDQIFSTSVSNLTFKYFDSQNPPNEVAPASASKVRVIVSLNEQTVATSEASLRND